MKAARQHPARTDRIDIDASGDEQSHNFHVPARDCVKERQRTGGVGVGAKVEQRSHNLGRTGAHGDAERRQLAKVAIRVSGKVGQQHVHGVGAQGGGGGAEQRAAQVANKHVAGAHGAAREGGSQHGALTRSRDQSGQIAIGEKIIEI